MPKTTDDISQRLHEKIDQLSPTSQRGLLLFINSLEDNAQEIEDVDPRDSLRQALREVKAGETRPVEGLWKRVGL